MKFFRHISCASTAALLFAETKLINGTGVDGYARNLASTRYAYEHYDGMPIGANSYGSSDGDKNTLDVTSDGEDSPSQPPASPHSPYFLTAVAAGNRAKRILESSRFSKVPKNQRDVPAKKKKKGRRRYAYVVEPAKSQRSDFSFEDEPWKPVDDYDYVYAYELEPTLPAEFDEDLASKTRKGSTKKESKKLWKTPSKGKKNEKRSTGDPSGGSKKRQDTSALISSVFGQEVQCDSAVGAMGLLLLINSMTTVLKEVMGPKMPIIGRRKRDLDMEDATDDSLTPLLSEPTMNSRQGLSSSEDEQPEEPLKRLFRSSAIPPSTKEDILVNETLTSLAPALRWYGEYLVTPKKDVLNCASQALCQACRDLTKKYNSNGTRLIRSLTGLLIGVLPDYHARNQAARAMEIGCTSAGLSPIKCGLPIAGCPTDQISAMINSENPSSTAVSPDAADGKKGTTTLSMTTTQTPSNDSTVIVT